MGQPSRLAAQVSSSNPADSVHGSSSLCAYLLCVSMTERHVTLVCHGVCCGVVLFTAGVAKRSRPKKLSVNTATCISRSLETSLTDQGVHAAAWEAAAW